MGRNDALPLHAYWSGLYTWITHTHLLLPADLYVKVTNSAHTVKHKGHIKSQVSATSDNTGSKSDTVYQQWSHKSCSLSCRMLKSSIYNSPCCLSLQVPNKRKLHVCASCLDIYLPTHLSHYVANFEDGFYETDQMSWMPHGAPGFCQHVVVLQHCTLHQLHYCCMQVIAPTVALKLNWTLWVCTVCVCVCVCVQGCVKILRRAHS